VSRRVGHHDRHRVRGRQLLQLHVALGSRARGRGLLLVDLRLTERGKPRAG
jgi:hypothetical protein